MRSGYGSRGAVRKGRLIAVVGPSGAGKDSLISYAREKLVADSAVLFVRRVVTRAALPGAEDHVSLSVESFQAALAANRFAVTWEAHGLHYAIPADVGRHLASGGVAVVNGSRAALPLIRAAFERVTVVHVTCRPDVLAARLAARGRENVEEQRLRLARATVDTEISGAIEVDNSGDLAEAGEVLVAAIRGGMP